MATTASPIVSSRRIHKLRPPSDGSEARRGIPGTGMTFAGSGRARSPRAQLRSRRLPPARRQPALIPLEPNLILGTHWTFRTHPVVALPPPRLSPAAASQRRCRGGVNIQPAPHQGGEWRRASPVSLVSAAGWAGTAKARSGWWRAVRVAPGGQPGSRSGRRRGGSEAARPVSPRRRAGRAGPGPWCRRRRGGSRSAR